MLKYIYWKNEETYVILKINEFNEKLDYYKKNGQLVKYKTLRDEWNLKSYFYEEKGYYRHLYTFEGNGKYIHYTCNYIDDTNQKPSSKTKSKQSLKRKLLLRKRYQNT